MTNDADRIAALEREVEQLHGELAGHRPPPAALFPDGHAKISHLKNPVVLPAADELRRRFCSH
jgi:hypothetical protein